MEDENVEEGIQQEDAIWGDTGGVQEDRLCVCEPRRGDGIKSHYNL